MNKYEWKPRRRLGEVLSLDEFRLRWLELGDSDVDNMRLRDAVQLRVNEAALLPSSWAVSTTAPVELLIRRLCADDMNYFANWPITSNKRQQLRFDVPRVAQLEYANSKHCLVVAGINFLATAYAAGIERIPVWKLVVEREKPFEVDPLFLPQEHLANLEFLRAYEGDSVTLLCDNPDGPPDRAIECNGEWTGWQDRRFSSRNNLRSLESLVHEAAGFKWNWQQGELSDE